MSAGDHTNRWSGASQARAVVLTPETLATPKQRDYRLEADEERRIAAAASAARQKRDTVATDKTFANDAVVRIVDVLRDPTFVYDVLDRIEERVLRDPTYAAEQPMPRAVRRLFATDKAFVYDLIYRAIERVLGDGAFVYDTVKTSPALVQVMDRLFTVDFAVRIAERVLRDPTFLNDLFYRCLGAYPQASVEEIIGIIRTDAPNTPVEVVR